jgi:uncharacterized protein YqeY
MPSVEEIRAELTGAMKRRDPVATAALRSVLAAISHASTAGKGRHALSDDEITSVIAREVKRREEAMEAFAGAGRTDRAETERAERDVLTAFLPAPLSGEELQEIVDEVLAAGGFSGGQAMGPAMKQVMERVKGRADGRTVSDLVRSRLAARGE